MVVRRRARNGRIALSLGGAPALTTAVTAATSTDSCTGTNRILVAPPAIAESELVGASVCGDCRASLVEHFSSATHAALMAEGENAKTAGCESCHGPVTETIDLRSQYFYYNADDYENISSTSQPYGANAKEHGVSLQLGYQMSDGLRWRAGFAYFTNDEKTAGGANDYGATVLTGGVDMKF